MRKQLEISLFAVAWLAGVASVVGAQTRETVGDHVAATTNPAVIAGLKMGDPVDLTWTEAIRFSEETPGVVQAPIPYDPFSHRFTVSVLWGVDNQVSGKLIKESSGRTTQGAPINLDETTYDDVFGRMALFKIGVGYRTSPRTEGVFNFVISRSSSEPVQIGRLGLAQAPLFAQFDDYNYWGIEGGQRFYFTRVRFTPYVGYLVGLNRFDHMNATFVSLPAGFQPGYASADTKFFESSWALSFGPTGGVLIGLGPIEVMAEVALRYMGGLSDVDWLVEEGLRDINSESSRWSFPILFGARVRF